ncbi:hypothetical protein L1887_51470 [Cichorium endivia]|nr:hypothetical protein L1887_51470 [Cichorium endivia]
MVGGKERRTRGRSTQKSIYSSRLLGLGCADRKSSGRSVDVRAWFQRQVLPRLRASVEKKLKASGLQPPQLGSGCANSAAQAPESRFCSCLEQSVKWAPVCGERARLPHGRKTSTPPTVHCRSMARARPWHPSRRAPDPAEARVESARPHVGCCYPVALAKLASTHAFDSISIGRVEASAGGGLCVPERRKRSSARPSRPLDPVACLFWLPLRTCAAEVDADVRWPAKSGSPSFVERKPGQKVASVPAWPVGMHVEDARVKNADIFASPLAGRDASSGNSATRNATRNAVLVAEESNSYDRISTSPIR